MVYKVLTDQAHRHGDGRALHRPRDARAEGNPRANGRAVRAGARVRAHPAQLGDTQYPNGLANSSGVLGHYLMDHMWVGRRRQRRVPRRAGAKPSSIGAPRRPNGLYAIRFRNTMNGPREKDFIRGYGFQGGGAHELQLGAPGFGDAYKKADEPDQLSARVSRAASARRSPRFENFVELDPEGTVDAFGIPVLKHHDGVGREREGDDSGHGGRRRRRCWRPPARRTSSRSRCPTACPGYGIHEVGIARMGGDPKTSVLNQFCQTHDVKNLFVMDGSSSSRAPARTRRSTIMALAVRSTAIT